MKYKIIFAIPALIISFFAFSADKVSWSVDNLDLQVKQGTSQQIELTVTNVADVEGIKLHVVPALQKWISVTPTYIEDTTSSQTHRLSVDISIDEDTPIGIYEGVIQVREVRAGKPKNVLPTPLSVTLSIIEKTIDNLPPEPGPENNLTVAGVDSDKDGVRDDVQRYIALRFPNDEATRLALLDVARAWQFGLIEADIPEAAYKNTKNFFSKYECLYYISDENASDYIVDMRSVLLNTTLRSDAYIRYNNNAAGNNYLSPPTKDYYKQCSFDVKTLLGEG